MIFNFFNKFRHFLIFIDDFIFVVDQFVEVVQTEIFYSILPNSSIFESQPLLF